MIDGGDAGELREAIEQLGERQQQLVALAAHNMATLQALAWCVQASLPVDSPVRLQLEKMLGDRTVDSQRIIDRMADDHAATDAEYWDRPQPE